MAKKRQSFDVGDVFVHLNADGLYSVGQVVGREAAVLNSVSVALSGRRVTDPAADVVSITTDDVISSIFTTRDLLDAGTWRIVGQAPICLPRHLLPHESARASGYVGAKVYGSGSVVKFLDAYFGLRPWDDFHDPHYLDRLLLSPDKRPEKLVLTKERWI